VVASQRKLQACAGRGDDARGRKRQAVEKESLEMSEDELAIRHVVETWMTATQAGDIATVLDLMTDDVIFMVPGAEPFGKDGFAAASKGMKNVRISGKSDIREIRILGDWAYIRNHIDMTATPADGKTMRRSGYTLTILRKETDGRWRLARDANLLTEQK
jgi:uncharacterized protein (TIGR02246 family)